MLIVELKSDAVKERHWKQLMRRLHVSWVPSELTLGHLWDINLNKNEQAVREVLLVAQGEKALEEFLKQVQHSLYGLKKINLVILFRMSNSFPLAINLEQFFQKFRHLTL